MGLKVINQEQKIPNYMKFVLGGSAGMLAICIVQPLDLIKNRMQLSKDKTESFVTVVRNIYQKEGPLEFYNGLSAGLLRQATYTTARLGIYTWLFDLFSTQSTTPSFAVKACLGICAGAVGSFIGTPAEVTLIRMTADGRLPPELRRNYKNAIHALYRIVKEEGVLALWTGAIPTMGRAMVVNAAQLGTYSQAKEMFLATGLFSDNLLLYVCSSMTSGLITTIVSMPVDILKTRIQSMVIKDGVPEYSGATDVLKKIIAREGVLALWNGFIPYLFKIGPHTVLTFIFLENLTYYYKRYAFQQKVL